MSRWHCEAVARLPADHREAGGAVIPRQALDKRHTQIENVRIHIHNDLQMLKIMIKKKLQSKI